MITENINIEKKQIVNIINFVRGCEPRTDVDLKKPVIEQLKLLGKYGFTGTFLIQYDALVSDDFAAVRQKIVSARHEIGVWLEIVQPLVEDAGYEWRGRYPWDWHADVGFSVGYTREQRKKLIDVLFERFKSTFGYYPRVIGSWIIDAYTLKYANDKYGLDASCNCKEQWGTDGYTLWGAYYNQAYYPSISNVFCPAGKAENQINVPIFRMLGSDPVLQYDSGLDLDTGASERQGVVTLEPVYCGAGGGDEKWVDWYLRENFNGKCLAFSYAQAGQENSFGWEDMRDGLRYQFRCFSEMQKNGTITVESLGESGRNFKARYILTPATTITAESDFYDSGKKSVWYNCKNYRVNVYCENNQISIRDMHIFDDSYRERYLNDICSESVLKFDNLPVVDGNRWSGNGIRAGLFFRNISEPLSFEKMEYSEKDESTAVLTFYGTACGLIKVILSETQVLIEAENPEDFSLLFRYGEAKMLPEVVSVDNHQIKLKHNRHEYALNVTQGTIQKERMSVVPEKGRISLSPF